MTAKELNIKLYSFFPELESEYNDCVSWQDGHETGSHVVFSSVLVPYIIKSANEQNFPALRKCFDFIEAVLSYEDFYSEGVIAFSVLESLIFSEEMHTDIYQYLKPKTRKLFNELIESQTANQ